MLSSTATGALMKTIHPQFVSEFNTLSSEYAEGLITDKGYAKRYNDLLEKSRKLIQETEKALHLKRISLVLTGGFNAFSFTNNPNSNPGFLSSNMTGVSVSPHHRRLMSTDTTGSFSDRLQINNSLGIPQSDLASMKTGVSSTPLRNGTAYSPKKNIPESMTTHKHKTKPEPHRILQHPLKPRDKSTLTAFEKLDSLPLILRERAKTYGKDLAILACLKQKDSNSITWEKLYGKAEKVAQQILKKSSLFKGDRIILIYHEVEIIEFAIAFFGCLLAGMVAVPIANSLVVNDIIKVMELTRSKLVFVSDSVHKLFEKSNNDLKIPWPKNTIFLKTEDLGTFQLSKKHDPPALNLPDLAYIEYSKYPVEIKGVVFSHKTIMHQMRNLKKIIASSPTFATSQGIYRDPTKFSPRRDSILCNNDIRSSIGLVLGLLFTVYSGTLLIWTPSAQMDVPGLYANMITKYHATVLVSDLLSLKAVAFNYQMDPDATLNSLIVNSEVIEIISSRWLQPLGCSMASEVVAPALSLSEYGGIIVSIRDWCGNFEELGCKFTVLTDEDAKPYTDSDLSEVIIDKDSLSTNTVKLISDRPLPPLLSFDSKASSKSIRVGAFGFPLIDATMAIVNPETLQLAAPMEVGEVWVDSPCLSGGYWESPEHNASIFHARCRDNEGYLPQDFLRTGLLGFIYNGKVYVLGLYEDRFRQRVTWIDKELQNKLGQIKEEEEEDFQQQQQLYLGDNTNPVPVYDNGYRYHYSDHIASTIYKRVAEVECTTFDIFVNGEHVPIIIIETPLASSGRSYNQLDILAIEVFHTLEKYHKVRVLCCGFTPDRALPRALKSGRIEIANMLCKAKFLKGNLKLNYVKFNIIKSISNIAVGDDIPGGIWSLYTSAIRRKSLPESNERQYTGIDERKVTVDDRLQAPLTDFKTIVDVLRLRIINHADSLAFSLTNDPKKALSWKLFDLKVSALCQYILEKTHLSAGQNVLLMYNLSEDYIIALYACFLLGIVPIPIAEINANNAGPETRSYAKICEDFEISMVFTNNETESLVFKNKLVSAAIKTHFILKKPPVVKSTTKIKPVKNMSQLKSHITTAQGKFKFRNNDTIALIYLDWTPDGNRIGIKYNHSGLMNICKILKETFKLGSFNSIMATSDYICGLGFFQSTMLGVYLGCSTYLFPQSTFQTSSALFFNALGNYKIKDTLVTMPILSQAYKQINGNSQYRVMKLESLDNMMVCVSGRPDERQFRAYRKLISNFMKPTSFNVVYSHRFNPIITARSYLSFAPVVIHLDLDALRRGFVSIVDQEKYPESLALEDSGVVLCCTQVAIVNPQTKQICKSGEYGEIWVSLEANATGYSHGNKYSRSSFISSQFNCTLNDTLPGRNFLRTGDLGFLHVVKQNGLNGDSIDIQLLYVLGNISETFEVMGMNYFACDIEATVEKCHDDIISNSAVAFKCDDQYTVVICATKRALYLASLVPLIFKSVLNTHKLIVDIVCFIPALQAALSSSGEKMRATVVGKWNNGMYDVKSSFGVNYGESSVIETMKKIQKVLEVISVGNESVINDSNSLSAVTTTATEYSISSGSSIFE